MSATKVYDGWRKIFQKEFRLPNGEISTFDVVGNNNFVTVAAFTPRYEAILVRQFRPGPEQVLVSFPEGYIDEGEQPEQAAFRELLEETGYAAGRIRLLRTFRSAYNTETRYCLLAEDCVLKNEQQLDQEEFIEVFTLPEPALRAFLQDHTDHSFTNVDAAYLALDAMGRL